MVTGDEGRLRAIVTEVTAARGYDLEELTVRSMGRRRVVRVVVDSDDGVSLDDAAAVSREISERLDDPDDPMGDPMGEQSYTLEVTSPGIGRPLREPRHFRRARGRLIAVSTGTGPVTGHLLRVGDHAVELAVVGPKDLVRTVEVSYGDITGAKVEVEFSPPPAAVQDLLESAGVTR
ncbi:MAG TPA: ribosome maturation factor RimP [Nakamurella sp.]